MRNDTLTHYFGYDRHHTLCTDSTHKYTFSKSISSSLLYSLQYVLL